MSVGSTESDSLSEIRVREVDEAYGSLIAFGVSSIGPSHDPSAENTTTRRNPSCPYAFAFFVKGWVKVRPAEVRANRWSSPADTDTNLHN